jgi:hypothetical protein
MSIRRERTLTEVTDTRSRGRLRRLRPGRRFTRASLVSALAYGAYATSDRWAPRARAQALALAGNAQDFVQQRRERRNQAA